MAYDGTNWMSARATLKARFRIVCDPLHKTFADPCVVIQRYYWNYSGC